MKQNASITPPVRVGGHSHVTSGQDSGLYRTKHTGLNENTSEWYKHVTVQSICIGEGSRSCLCERVTRPTCAATCFSVVSMAAFLCGEGSSASLVSASDARREVTWRFLKYWTTNTTWKEDERTEWRTGGRMVCVSRGVEQQRASVALMDLVLLEGSELHDGATDCLTQLFTQKHPTTTSVCVCVCHAADRSVK